MPLAPGGVSIGWRAGSAPHRINRAAPCGHSTFRARSLDLFSTKLKLAAWIAHNGGACQTLDPSLFGGGSLRNPMYRQTKFLCGPGGRIFTGPRCVQFQGAAPMQDGVETRAACLKFGTRLQRTEKLASPVIKMTHARLARLASRPARQISHRIPAAVRPQLNKLVRSAAIGEKLTAKRVTANA